MIHEFTSKGMMVSHPFKPGIGVVIVATGVVGYISAIKRPDFDKRFGVTAKGKSQHFFAIEEIRVLERPQTKKPTGLVNKQYKFSLTQTAHIKSMSGRFGSESEYLRQLVEADMEDGIAE